MDQTNYNISSSNQESLNQQKSKKKSGVKIFGLIILIIAVVAGSAYAGYWYREQKAKKALQSANQQIADLQKQKQELEKAKAKQEKENEKEKKESTTTATSVPTDELKTNIQDAVKAGNISALEGYIASPVKVILAASEGLGDRTPQQAVADLKYISEGTDPWNFALPESTLSAWRAGPYKQYFPPNAVVGKSANGYVISFSFNSEGKISTIFMTSDADLLQQ